MIFKNSKLYDVLKWLSLVALNAFGVAYNALADVWGLPYGQAVQTTCAIISVLIGTLIGVSGHKYFKDNVIKPRNLTPEEIEALED